MYLVVRIDGDPTYWSLQWPEDSKPFADELASSKDPLSVGVTGPLAGTMLISPQRVGSMAILDDESIGSWVPSGIEAPSAEVLYVPSDAGPTKQFPGYALPAETNLGDLSQEILAAMRSGEVITTPIVTDKGRGKLRIDGGVLAFAVVGQATPATPAGQ